MRNGILVLLLSLAVTAWGVSAFWPAEKKLFQLTLLQDQRIVLYEATSIKALGFCTTFYQEGSRISDGYVSAAVCTSHTVVELPRPQGR